jgi:hypothetical protein
VTPRKRLDEILLRHGWVTEAQLVQALGEQKDNGGRLGTALVQLGYLSESQLAEALAEQFGTPVWDPETAILEEAAIKLFPEQWIRQKGILPLAYDPQRKHLEVAVTDPANIALAAEIKFHTKAKTIVMTVIPEISLKRVWQRYQQQKTEVKPAGRRPEPGSKAKNLGLHFTFAVEKPGGPPSPDDTENDTGVLLWLSQPFVAKLFKSLLEVEHCRVENWDGQAAPDGEWQYVIYDDDQLASQPQAEAALKRALPKIQFIKRPSWTTSLLRSPLSYERLRDGYIHLSEYVAQKFAAGVRDRRLSRYALAAARILPLGQFAIDSLMTACELAPLFAGESTDTENWPRTIEELRCPYPVADIYHAAAIDFDRSDTKPGESTTEIPLTGKVFAVARAFVTAVEQKPVNSIESLSELTGWLRSEAGKKFDPVVVEAMLRVVQEEVLDGCLPPGPAEVLMVADRPIEWHHLVLQLENEGWRVVKSRGAAEARRQVERRMPDVVIWAAEGALAWVQWQGSSSPRPANFLVLDEPDTALERAALQAGYEDVWSGQWDAGVAVAKLQRAVSRREKAVAETPSVSGSLQQLNFIDMVQILAAGNRSVRIDITDGPKKASVILWQGQIKFARTPDKEGEQAIYEILTWENGMFDLHPVETKPAVNCKLPNDMILLEGCRLMDEQRREPEGIGVTS